MNRCFLIRIDGTSFESRMTGMSQALYQQVAESAKLDEVITKNLKHLGFGETND